MLAMIMALGAAPSVAQDSAIPIVPNTDLALVPKGGAAGGDAVYCNNCDLIGPRNVQSGPNGLDLGAGSTANPANISLNWDVGKSTNIFEGHKRKVAHFGADGSKFYDPQTGKLLAWFGPRGIRFYVKPTIIR